MTEEIMPSSQDDAGDSATAGPAQPKPSMNLVELAQRIKQRRTEKRLTIEQLATRTGLTRSWLSKVENFRVTPSLPALFKIAANLGVKLSELVDGLDESPGLCLVRKNEGKVIDRNASPENNTRYESLAYQRNAKGMEPFLLTIPPGGGREQLLPHDGEEFLMVVSGSATFDYGGEVYELEEGDSLYFDGSTPHRVHNPNDETARVLCVFFLITR